MLEGRKCALLLVSALTIACDGVPTGIAVSGPNEGTARIRVIHTVVTVPAVDMLVGGQVVLTGITAGQASAFVSVPAGNQRVAFRPAGSSDTVPGTVVPLARDDSVTVLTVDSASVLNPWVLSDSGAAVPAGQTKLRAVHLAATAPPIDIWRTQPDFQSLITIMFPFRYREVSPYLQSDPGDWTILVTTERRDAQGIPVLGDSLLATGPIAVPSGQSRTVLILDQVGGGLRATVVEP